MKCGVFGSMAFWDRVIEVEQLDHRSERTVIGVGESNSVECKDLVGGGMLHSCQSCLGSLGLLSEPRQPIAFIFTIIPLHSPLLLEPSVNCAEGFTDIYGPKEK